MASSAFPERRPGSRESAAADGSVLALQTQLAATEAKVSNLARLMQLQQSVVEQQETELQMLKEQLKKVRPADYSGEFIAQVDATLSRAEARIQELVRQANDDLDFRQNLLLSKVQQTIDRASRTFQAKYQEVSTQLACQIDSPSRSVLEELKHETRAELLKHSKDLHKLNTLTSEASHLASTCLERVQTAETSLHDVQELLLTTSEEAKLAAEAVRELDPAALEDAVSDRVGDVLGRIGNSIRSYIMKQEGLQAQVTQLLKTSHSQATLKRKTSRVRSKPSQPARFEHLLNLNT